MVSFSTSNLPSGSYAIASVEELALWSTLVLQSCFPTDTYQESPNTTRINQVIAPEITIPDSRVIRICRAAIPVNTVAAQNLPAWKRVSSIGTVAFPTAFSIGS